MSGNTPNDSKNYFEITDTEKDKIGIKNQLDGYEKEKFDAMKRKFSQVIQLMDVIASDLEEADKLGIIIQTNKCKNHFDFASFYNSHMKQNQDANPIDFTALYSQLSNYNAELQKIITEAKKGKTEELKAAL